MLGTAMLLAGGIGCDAGGMTGDSSTDVEVPEVYEFNSRFEPEQSSVSYGGQTFRQVLIVALAAEIDAIQQELVDGTVFEDGEVAARLSFYYQFESATAGPLGHGLMTTPAPLQTSWDDLGSDKDLVSKIAGNDEVGQHRDWSTQMVGWSGVGPDALVQRWIEAVDDLAMAYVAQVPVDPNGIQIESFFVSPEGLDYQQLLQKFLLGAVNFSQGADDYLDDDLDGKGLLSDHTESDDGAPYTALEHAWDEGFGYWGGARDYLSYSDDELAGQPGRPEYAGGYHDADGDGAIDLKSEYNFGASINAAKRDRGSASAAPTDFTAQTMQAFLAGRAIIAAADGALTPSQLADLQEQRDRAVDGWERAIAATAVHYFNDVIQDMRATEYGFADHAKHWGELKGFLLSLQFNPRSSLNEADATRIHELVGEAPVVPSPMTTDDAVANLVEARDRLGAAYGFDAANLGDANGEGGW